MKLALTMLAAAGLMVGVATPAFAHNDRGAPAPVAGPPPGARHERQERQNRVTRLQADIGRDQQQIAREEQELKALQALPTDRRERHEQAELRERIEHLNLELARDRNRLLEERTRLQGPGGEI